MGHGVRLMRTSWPSRSYMHSFLCLSVPPRYVRHQCRVDLPRACLLRSYCFVRNTSVCRVGFPNAHALFSNLCAAAFEGERSLTFLLFSSFPRRIPTLRVLFLE